MSYRDRGQNSRRASLIIRNLPLDTRKVEVQDLFGKYGSIKDVYLPLNHYTRAKKNCKLVKVIVSNRDSRACHVHTKMFAKLQISRQTSQACLRSSCFRASFLRVVEHETFLVTSASSAGFHVGFRRFQGFGFVEFYDLRDAEDAQEALDGKLFGGRTLEVRWSRDDRKTPREMVRREKDQGVSRAPGSFDRGGPDRARPDRGDRDRDERGGHTRRRSYSPRPRRSYSPRRNLSPRPAGQRRDVSPRRDSPPLRRSPSPQNGTYERSPPGSPPRSVRDVSRSPRRSHDVLEGRKDRSLDNDVVPVAAQERSLSPC